MGLLIKFLLWSRYYLIEMIKLDSPMGHHRIIMEKHGSINLLWGPTLMLMRVDVFYASFKLITKYTTHKKGPRRSLLGYICNDLHRRHIGL